MHLDCLSDRAPGPGSISSAVRGSEGAWLCCSCNRSFGGRGIWGTGSWGNFTVFLFSKLSAARAPSEHSREHFVIIQGMLLWSPAPAKPQLDSGGRILEGSRLAVEMKCLKYPRESICKSGPATASSFPKWQAQYNSLWSCYLNRVPSPALFWRAWAGGSLWRFSLVFL